MKYRSCPDYRHGVNTATGILLSNLGTPDSPDTGSVRRYLAQFLWDPRVIEVPRLIWWLILHGFILRTRPQRSAAAYRKIWPQDGDSPLRHHLLQQASLLQQKLDGNNDYGKIHVEPAMRYGQPGIAQALRRLGDKGIQRLLVLPLYPQYSATTTASTFDAVSAELQQWRWLPELRFINCYHDYDPYIDAIAESIRNFQEEHGKPDKLLFSYHGLPQHYFMAGDPYHCACHKTTRLVTGKLRLAADDWGISFQSRLGTRPWLKPYTDELLPEWARSGIRKVQVICPGFSADCLETLEEVKLQYGELFCNSGGEQLQYIPALNSSKAHIDMMATLIQKHVAGWAVADNENELALGRQKAIDAGARQ